VLCKFLFCHGCVLWFSILCFGLGFLLVVDGLYFESPKVHFSLFLRKLVKVGKSLWSLNKLLCVPYGVIIMSWTLFYTPNGVGWFFNVSCTCVLQTGRSCSWGVFGLFRLMNFMILNMLVENPLRSWTLNEGLCNLKCWKKKKKGERESTSQFFIKVYSPFLPMVYLVATRRKKTTYFNQCLPCYLCCSTIMLQISSSSSFLKVITTKSST
jgi:hypothetical protein